MPKFIGLHSLPGYTQEMLRQTLSPPAEAKLKVTKLHATSEGKVICEVEAESREDFISWLNRINLPYDDVLQVDVTMVPDGVSSEGQGP